MCLGLAAIALTACASNNDKKVSEQSTEKSTEQSFKKSEQTEQSSKQSTEQSSKKSDDERKAEIKEIERTAEEGFISRKKIQQNLIRNKHYSEEAANYVIESANVDWKKQAAEQAKELIKEDKSTENLRAVLSNDLFTDEEIHYAIVHMNDDLYSDRN